MYWTRDGQKQLAKASWALGFGIEFPAYIMLGYFGGRWLDGRFGTAPWLQWLGLGFGFFAAGNAVFRLWKRAKQDMQSPSQKDSSDSHEG